MLRAVSGALNKVSGNIVPVWNEHMPTGAPRLPAANVPSVGLTSSKGLPRKVVYMPSCVTRMMGPSRGDDAAGDEAVHAKFLSLLDKAGYEVVVPDEIGSMCCGMIMDSRGFRTVGADQSGDMQARLLEASDRGRIPIVCDTSPCLQRMKEKFDDPLLKLALYEPVQFISLYLKKELDFSKVR